ncbi:MAG: EamA family transporter [Rhodothermales bacterium]|nr:EamA family transporter [Rhodothermales bacterium]
MRLFASSRSWAFVMAFGSVYLIWGSTYLAIKVAVETIPPFLMLATRFGLAGLLLYAYLRLSGHAAPRRREWLSSMTVGGLMLAGGTGSLAWAEQFVSSGLAALLVSTAPVWMVVLDWLAFGGNRPGWITYTGIAVGFAGIFVLVDPIGVLAGTEINYLAAGVIVFGALSWSLGSLQSRQANLPSSPFMAASLQMICGGFILFVGGVLSGEIAQFDTSAISTSSYLGWAYLFFVGSFIPFNAYIWLMRNTTAAKVSTYAFVNPIVAVLLGWLFLNEPITINMIVAIGLLLGGVVLITQRSRRRSRLRPVAPPLICYDLDDDRKLIVKEQVIAASNGSSAIDERPRVRDTATSTA